MKPRRAVRKFRLLRGEKRHPRKVKTQPPLKKSKAWLQFARRYRNSPEVIELHAR